MSLGHEAVSSELFQELPDYFRVERAAGMSEFAPPLFVGHTPLEEVVQPAPRRSSLSQQLMQDDAQRIDIRANVDEIGASFDLFRADPGESPEELPSLSIGVRRS